MVGTGHPQDPTLMQGRGASKARTRWQSFFFFFFPSSMKYFPSLEPRVGGGVRLGSHVALLLLATGCFPGRGDISLAMGRVPLVLLPDLSKTSEVTVTSCLFCGLA